MLCGVYCKNAGERRILINTNNPFLLLSKV